MASGIFVNESGRILVSLFFWIGKRVTTLLPIFFYHKLAQSLLTMGLGRVVTPPAVLHDWAAWVREGPFSLNSKQLESVAAIQRLTVLACLRCRANPKNGWRAPSCRLTSFPDFLWFSTAMLVCDWTISSWAHEKIAKPLSSRLLTLGYLADCSTWGLVWL